MFQGIIASNPCVRADAPAVGQQREAMVRDKHQPAALAAGFKGPVLYPVVAVAAFTVARRNEIMARSCTDFDAIAGALRIERAIDQGQRLTTSKPMKHIRTLAIDAGLAELLKAERDKYLRLASSILDGADADLSLVKLPEGALIFPSPSTLVRP